VAATEVRANRKAPASHIRNGTGGRPGRSFLRPLTEHGRTRLLAVTAVGGGPPGTRTRNLRIKSPLLYPIELEAREREYIKLMRLDRGVTEGTRTPNPQDHNLAL
jgi:hypothetical protein